MSVKRRLLVLAGVVLVAGIGLTVYFLVAQPTKEAGIAPPTNTTQSEVPAEIKQLEATFNSPDIATQSKALAPGLDEQYQQQGQSPLAAGAKLEFDYTSYQTISDDAATIEAKLSNGERYRVHFVRQAGHWYIWNTEER